MPTGLGDEQLWISATNDNTGSSTAFNDLSGEGNNGTASGTTVIADTSEGGSYAFDFDGTNDYIDTGSTTVHQNNVFTYAFWLNASASTSGTEGTAGSYGTGNSRGPLACSTSGNNKMTWLYMSLGNSYNPAQRVDSVGDAYDSTWRHIACMFDGDNNEVKIYIDGVLDVSKTASVPNTVNISTALKFGSGGGGFTDGRMDDIRVFNRTLSQAEVAHLATSRGIEGSPFSGLGDEQLWLCPSLSDNANDISGNGNNGTYQGGMGTVADTSNGGTYAYDFDGTDDRIDCPSTVLGGSQEYSMSCWAYVDSHDATYGEGFVGQWESNVSSNQVGIIYAGATTSFRGLVTAGGTNYSSTATGSSPPTGAWYHLASVVDGSDVTLYVDGVSQGSTPHTGSINSSPTNAFEIGRYKGSGTASNRHCLNGKMDDVRAYQRALTQAEITHLASSRGVGGPAGGGPDPPDPPTGFYNPFINKIFNPNYVRRIG